MNELYDPEGYFINPQTDWQDRASATFQKAFPERDVPVSKHEAKLDQAAKGYGPESKTYGNTTEPAKESYHDRKFDNGKSRIDLIPGEALDALGDVLAYGAQKYAPNSWQLVPDAKQRYISALGRHYAAMLRGETVDPESGKLHVEHILTNAAFITYFERRGI